MPRARLKMFVVLIALCLNAAQFTNFVSGQRSATDTYAITNARIVTVSGPVIERGTVVVRDGLIAGVGGQVSAPADARVIDGTGLTIYPGLIDANTSLGIPEPSPAPSPAGGPGGGGPPQAQRQPGSSPSAPNSTQPPGLQPEIMPEDLIKPGGADIESARTAGISTVLSAPRSGIWMGQSALINLAGDTPQQMIVRSPVAMHIGFTPLRGSGYPGSLMGVFASLRQMMLDADRYRNAQQIYERAPRATRRPDLDRSLAALIPVLERKMPVVMYANTEREIERALDLAKEFNLRAIIAGGSEAARLSGRLVEQEVPVLLSLNFPKRTTAAIPEADPEPLRLLRARVEAQKTAAKLAAARVRFAFQSGAMANITDFLPNAAKAVENGLAREEALRALTIHPAEILGVSDRLGSIEVGKIANLTVTRGDIFARNTRITHVFIDGRPVDLRPATTTAQGRGGAAGTWSLKVDLGQGEQDITLTLQQEGERLRGSMQGALGGGDISNASTTTAGEIRFTVSLTSEGQTREATFAGTITGNEMKGTVEIVGRAPGSFTGTRPGP
jgi:imidazolonepropionase-like amidohydrolase